MAHDKASTFGRHARRAAGIGLLVAGVVALGLLGWQWRANVTVDRVAVTGTRHAPPDTLRRLARVDRGAAMTAVEPTLVADRVARHPWVKGATVEPKWMRGVLALAVTERTPAALAVDAQGRPAYYLDRNGHAMPLPDSTGYDVPLVRGLEAEAPWTRPDTAESPSSLRRVLRALPEAGVADLVAEIEIQAGDTIRLTTTPIGPHDALPVHLGSGDVPQKLRTLRAFARQVLTSSPDEPIEHIDLRFDGQVVTRTQPLDG
ncbi:cell division protein FtsQ/DivIB [Salinibacter grassmerensis]|uniref:cell division protein FtsQ/DivIB n=1 Tax=Salinibacter grassmerensis TaxID=3040353 RepID=UPI0021E98FE7|nr:FtsQ-type POTRA domain-containing protein [Salinibacter grassmerensis]